ncbi:MAG: peptidoglycan editing factor PgeF [Deltaproteobacteria bacterium]|nr:peptidoglycan editing factor PgeF [Deltaproteobacteria bacterium]MBW2123502.1 peptidoglycan editing factor PgeF [Deltaproteobacteria bacterium]
MARRCGISSLRTGGGLGFFRAAHFEATGLVVHAFSTRQGGVSPAPFDSLNLGMSSGEKEANVKKNREILTRAFGFSSRALVTARQIHGDDILVIDSASPEGFAGAPCDAMVTDRPGVAVAVLTADCLPLLLLDPVHRTVAAVHLGWKGTALNLCGKTVGLLRERFGARPECLLAAVGPSIGPCCYEVDESLRSSFTLEEHRWDHWARPSGSGRWKLDLQRANIDLMTDSGILEGNIVWFDICTRCREDLFFSYRRDGEMTGRQMAFIMLK